MEKISKLFKISDSSILAFTLGFCGVVVMASFQMLGFHPYQLISPIISHTHVESVEEKIIPKLEKIKNNYKIKSERALFQKAYASEDYDGAKAYGVVDFNSGSIVLGKDTDSPLPIASLTKIMSAVVLLDLKAPNDYITISKNAKNVVPTKIGVVAGEKMKVSELVAAMLLTSANDAAQAAADGIDAEYGKGAFVFAMNEKAAELGLANTHFANPQGFDNNSNYSTVADLANLSHFALSNYPTISEIAQKDYEFLPSNNFHKQFDLYNWNGLVDVYPSTIGLKIGNTDAAGYTTIVVSSRNDKKLISIILGAPGIYERDLWAADLLDAAYLTSNNLPPIGVSKEDLSQKYKTWKYFN